MMRRILTSLTLAAAMAMPAMAQDAEKAALPSVDDLVAKHVQAIGGMDKIKAVKSMKVSGKLEIGQGMEAPVVMYQKRPDDVRMEFTLQGLTAVQAYDGKTGWFVMPFQGKKDAEPMGEDDLKEIKEQADFDGPLVDYKTKGNKVELVGKVPVEGSDAYKLKVTLPDGTVRYTYLDADSYLPIKEESKRTIRGTERETESTIGDYKEEGGLMMAHSIQQGVKGSPEKQTITLEKFEMNVPVDDNLFKMPEKKAEPAPITPKDEKKPEVKK